MTISKETLTKLARFDSPTICNVVPTTAKSPLAHVACWRRLMPAKSGKATAGEAMSTAMRASIRFSCFVANAMAAVCTPPSVPAFPKVAQTCSGVRDCCGRLSGKANSASSCRTRLPDRGREYRAGTGGRINVAERGREMAAVINRAVVRPGVRLRRKRPRKGKR